MLQHRRRDGFGVVLCLFVRERYAERETSTEPAVRSFHTLECLKAAQRVCQKATRKQTSQPVVNQALLTQQTKPDLWCRVSSNLCDVATLLFPICKCHLWRAIFSFVNWIPIGCAKNVFEWARRESPRRWIMMECFWLVYLALSLFEVQKPCAPKICAKQQAHKIHNGFMLYVHVAFIFYSSPLYFRGIT